MGSEETTNLGGSQERWIPDPNDHARFCTSATSQTVLYMIFFKLKLVLIDAIHKFFEEIIYLSSIFRRNRFTEGVRGGALR